MRRRTHCRQEGFRSFQASTARRKTVYTPAPRGKVSHRQALGEGCSDQVRSQASGATPPRRLCARLPCPMRGSVQRAYATENAPGSGRQMHSPVVGPPARVGAQRAKRRRAWRTNAQVRLHRKKEREKKNCRRGCLPMGPIGRRARAIDAAHARACYTGPCGAPRPGPV